MVLRTDIRHVEAFRLGASAPVHVGCGHHVTAVVARTFVVGGRHLVGRCHFGVGQEIVLPAACGRCLAGGQFPRHPVGIVVLAVEGEREARVPNDLFGHSLEARGQFHQSLVAWLGMFGAIFGGTGRLFFGSRLLRGRKVEG